MVARDQIDTELRARLVKIRGGLLAVLQLDGDGERRSGVAACGSGRRDAGAGSGTGNGSERRDAGAYQSSAYNSWGGPGDGSRSRDELHALKALELEDDADFETVKKSWRRLAKENHPDVKPNDKDAALKFQAIQAAYDVLRTAEERRTFKP